MNNIILTEEEQKQFMSKQEIILKNKMVDLLKRKHHAKYAQRLEAFNVNIVPLKVDPNFTAAISFDNGVIYISEGFIPRKDINGKIDNSLFDQLDVLMRHELSHNLLMHQIRMMHKMGDDLFPDYKFSNSLQDLLNIIMDFEISNTRYTDEDKQLVRHLFLNGREIKGLVTEDDRQAWIEMPVEQMYDELSKELDDIHSKILNDRLDQLDDSDFLTRSMLGDGTFEYVTEFDKPSRLMSTPENFINNQGTLWLGGTSQARITELPQYWQEALKKVYEITTAPDSFYLDKKNLENLAEDIKKSTPTVPYKLEAKDKNEVTDKNNSVILASPELKWVTLELLKSMLGRTTQSIKINVVQEMHTVDYIEAYNKVIEAYGSRSRCSDEELKDVFAEFTRAVGDAPDDLPSL